MRRLSEHEILCITTQIKIISECLQNIVNVLQNPKLPKEPYDPDAYLAKEIKGHSLKN
jgi:hypothetical protein